MPAATSQKTSVLRSPGRGARPFGLVVPAWRFFARYIYRAYEHQLLRQILAGPVARHIGIILDGNRRYAAQQGFPEPQQVYNVGAGKLDEVLDWCGDLGIRAVTLWVCSTHNLSRPEQDVNGILGAVEAKLREMIDHPEIHRREIRVRAAGRLELLPGSLVETVRTAEAATAGYSALTLTIAVAYGGREEIADAVRNLLRDRAEAGATISEVLAEITPRAIGQHMYLADLPDPDLIIRTSGETRLSGFLLWQSAYSEYYFSDVYWPAFRKIDFLRAVRSYQQRKRRFGQ